MTSCINTVMESVFAVMDMFMIPGMQESSVIQPTACFLPTKSSTIWPAVIRVPSVIQIWKLRKKP